MVFSIANLVQFSTKSAVLSFMNLSVEGVA
jgi:hypothetical protein